jgi:hypothetical protein
MKGVVNPHDGIKGSMFYPLAKGIFSINSIPVESWIEKTKVVVMMI